MLNKIKKVFLVVLIAICLAGCGTLGPRVLPSNRQQYNSSLQQSSNEQMLLNIVRLRYGDTPYFLNVDSIEAQMQFDVRGGAGASFTSNTINDQTSRPPYSQTTDVDANMGFVDKPLISYRPLQGAVFANQILKPINIDTILLLNQSGWAISRILLITVQQAAGIKNAPESARLATTRTPIYKQFVSFVEELHDLDDQEIIEIKAVKSRGKNPHPMLSVRFIGKQKDKAAYMNLLHSLGINQFMPRIYFEQTETDRVNADTFGLITRSFIGVLFYLSKGVDVAPEELKAGIAPATYQNGKYFNWQLVLKGVFHVYCSKQQPKNAEIKVYYRGKWYFISDSDEKSKETFDLVQLLFSLQAGDSRSAIAPVMSIAI